VRAAACVCRLRFAASSLDRRRFDVIECLFLLSGVGLLVGQGLPKPSKRVRFPYPAPFFQRRPAAVGPLRPAISYTSPAGSFPGRSLWRHSRTIVSASFSERESSVTCAGATGTESTTTTLTRQASFRAGIGTSELHKSRSSPADLYREPCGQRDKRRQQDRSDEGPSPVERVRAAEMRAYDRRRDPPSERTGEDVEHERESSDSARERDFP
jgi:hypothetical protein